MVAAETPLKMIDKRSRHGFLGHETHRQGRRHRPETAERRAEQHAPDEQHGEVESESRDQVGDQQEDSEAEHQGPAVQVPYDRRDEEAGEQCDDGGRGDRLSGRALADPEIGRDRREQACRQEFGSDEGEDAQSQRAHRGPGGVAGARIAIVGVNRRQVGRRRCSRSRFVDSE